jgi:hypothetical protein
MNFRICPASDKLETEGARTKPLKTKKKSTNRKKFSITIVSEYKWKRRTQIAAHPLAASNR